MELLILNGQRRASIPLPSMKIEPLFRRFVSGRLIPALPFFLQCSRILQVQELSRLQRRVASRCRIRSV